MVKKFCEHIWLNYDGGFRCLNCKEFRTEDPRPIYSGREVRYEMNIDYMGNISYERFERYYYYDSSPTGWLRVTDEGHNDEE